MADTPRPTVSEVAATVEGVEQRIGEIHGTLEDLRQSRTARLVGASIDVARPKGFEPLTY